MHTGLVGISLSTMCTGATAILFSPLSFLRKPLLWLDLITRYRGTVMAAPHFGYKLVARRLASVASPGVYDLSSIKFALDAAESVHPSTKEYILEVLGKCGLSRDAYGVGYGLAEHGEHMSLMHVCRRFRASALVFSKVVFQYMGCVSVY